MSPAKALPAGWPADKPLALSVSVMLEGWTDDAAPGIGPMGNPLKAGVLDLQARSWAEYGPKVGAWRLLDILERLKIRSVFYVSGILAERYPDLMQAIAEAGHVVAAHGWSQHIIPSYQTAEEEARDLARCMAALEKSLRPPAAGLAEPALHAQHAHLGTAGEIRLRLARRLLRLRPALSPRDTGRAPSPPFRSPWR